MNILGIMNHEISLKFQIHGNMSFHTLTTTKRSFNVFQRKPDVPPPPPPPPSPSVCYSRLLVSS